MKYIKSIKDTTWTGKLDDGSRIPDGFIEINKDEYDKLSGETFCDLCVDEPCC